MSLCRQTRTFDRQDVGRDDSTLASAVGRGPFPLRPVLELEHAIGIREGTAEHMTVNHAVAEAPVALRPRQSRCASPDCLPRDAVAPIAAPVPIRRAMLDRPVRDPSPSKPMALRVDHRAPDGKGI
ncbi:hypothetical protein MMR14E_11010 [Methylobacterium mesophilicum]